MDRSGCEDNFFGCYGYTDLTCLAGDVSDACDGFVIRNQQLTHGVQGK